MSTFDIIGYVAAVITNVSAYPQAREVYVIINTEEFEKLYAISLSMYLLQTTGCVFWLVYGVALKIYPIIFGSIMCVIPSSYIIFGLIKYRECSVRTTPEIYESTTSPDLYISEQTQEDNTQIIIASGCSFPPQETEEY